MSRKGKRPEYSVEQRLRLYAERVIELLRYKFFDSAKDSSFKLTATSDPPTIEHSIKEPDVELFRSYMLLFRQFLSDREPVHFNRVANDCWKHLESDELRDSVQHLRKLWRDTLQTPFREHPSDTGKSINLGQLIDLWMYGNLFHSDDLEKRELYKEIAEEDIPLARWKVQTTVWELSRCLLRLATIIGHGFSDRLFDTIADPRPRYDGSAIVDGASLTPEEAELRRQEFIQRFRRELSMTAEVGRLIEGRGALRVFEDDALAVLAGRVPSPFPANYIGEDGDTFKIACGGRWFAPEIADRVRSYDPSQTFIVFIVRRIGEPDIFAYEPPKWMRPGEERKP